MSPRSSLKPRRGFVMVTAIVLMGLVGLSLAIMAATLGRDAKRTYTEAQDAQLRQLLLAGVAWTAAHGQEITQGAAKDVALPPALAKDSKLRITATKVAGTEIVVEILATSAGRTMTEQITLARDGNRYKPISVHNGSSF